MTTQDCVVFDLDGTLCNVNHRRQFVASRPRNWNAWNGGIINDTPNQSVLDVFNALKLVFPVFFVSGRSDDYRDVTVEWFRKWGIHDDDYNGLFMRKFKDYRDDGIVKHELADQIVAQGFNIRMVFDDRKRVLDMWHKRGVFTFDVSQGKGDF